MFTVYGRPNCQYCDSAKALLTAKALPFQYLTIGVDIEADEVKEMFPGATTVPLIRHDGINVGGFDALRKMLA